MPCPSWNLTGLFQGPEDPNIHLAFSSAKAEALELVTRYKGKLLEKNPQEIRTLLETYEAILEKVARPEVYASLRHAMDTRVPEHGAFLQEMRQRSLETTQELLFVELEIAALPAETLLALIEAPELGRYKHVLEQIRANQPHKLSETEERLWNDLSLTGREAFRRLFDEEEGRFFVPFRGETRSLTDLLQLLHESDSSTRREAAAALSAGFTNNLPRAAFIYNTLLQEHRLDERYRKFENAEHARHLSNETTQTEVDALANAVEEAYPLFQRYYTWKRQLLGLETLADYDRYAPLSTHEKTYSFEEAQTLVLGAFRDFSPTFATLAEAFFANGWIDAEIRPGKAGGAFCSYATADTHPYILVNFGGKIGDVLTLAHELGHAIHASLARPVGYLQFSTPLTLAETASVFAEMIVFDALKAKITDPQEKLGLYLHKIESVFATVFRQICLYRFEQDAHAAIRAQGEQSGEALNELWAARQKALFGDAITLTDGYKTWWSYISHFFQSPFYVYAYAFGELLTLSLYAKYKKEGASFAETYARFLASGGSQAPAQLLSPLEVDLRSVETWKTGLRLIEDLIEEAKNLNV